MGLLEWPPNKAAFVCIGQWLFIFSR